MIIFLDGVPGSGKSFDTVRTHMLAALKAGRHVYYRLKLQDHQRWADYLGMPLDQVNSLLHHVRTDELLDLFVSYQDPEQDNEWVISDQFKNALICIDEVHEFYPTTRQKLAPKHEQFYAKHRHYGLDIVLMTQHFKGMHTAIRYRIERMNRYQKMSGVGMDNRCLVRHYQSTAPEKFEEVGTSTFEYDPAIFPLYKGYAAQDVKTQVYDSGRKTVWGKIGPIGVAIAIVAVLGIVTLFRFFHGAGEPKPSQVQHVGTRPSPDHLATGVPAVAVKPKAPDMPPGPSYVWGLNGKGRARLAGILTVPPGIVSGLIEWRSDGGDVLDSLTFDQLRGLGVNVAKTAYGAVIEYGKQSIVVTPWPLPPVQQDPSQPSAQPAQGQSSAQVATDPQDSTDWHVKPVAAVYVPPQAQKPLDRSTWSPGGH